MAQSGFTPIQLYFSTTGAAVPSAGNLANGELAINITDGRLFYKDNSGTVQVLATKAGANGDVVGPASATDNALVRFDNISGKLVQNSVGILDDSGNLSGIAALTTSGALTLNGGTANGVAYLNGSKVLTTGSALTFDGAILGITGGTGIQAKIYNSGLTGTQASSIGVGKSETSGNTVFFGWANNNGSPFGYVGTYGGGAPLVLQPDGGNLGLGVTPSAWGTSFRAMQIGATGSVIGRTGTTESVTLSSNYVNNSGAKYIVNGYATQFDQYDGKFIWNTAPSGTAGNAISFTQAMTLDASGNLALGKTSTSYRLGLQVANSATNVSAFEATNATNASLEVFLRQDVTTINAGGAGNLVFATGGSVTERARIDSSGNLLVGTTSALGFGVTVSGGGTQMVHNFSSDYTVASFRLNGTQRGFITTTSAGTTFSTSSDYRLKEDIQPMTGALAKVAALKPVTYKWKADGSDGQGFIAHELQAVVPDCVTGEKDAVDADGKPVYQGIDTSFLVATLTAAIQEQQAIIEGLKARIETLDNK